MADVAAAAAAIPPPVLQFLICLMIGLLLQSFFTGFILMQGTAYFQSYAKSDKPMFKALVAYCMTLSFVYCVLYMTYAVLLYARGFGDLVYALTPNKLVVSTVLITPLIDGAVSIFYAYRAYKVLQNSITVAVLAGVVVCFQVCVGLLFGVAEARAKNFRTDHVVTISGPLNLIALCGTDAFLTVLLIIGLIRAQRQGTSQSTGKIISRLVLVAIEVNALPTLFQCLALILWYTTPFAYLCLTPSLPLIYVFTLFFWLHMRQTTRMALGGNVSTGNLSNRFIANMPVGRGSPFSASSPGVGAIQVQTLKEVHIDSDAFSVDPEKSISSQDDTINPLPSWSRV